MILKTVDRSELNKYEIELFVPEDAENIMLWVNEEGDAFGYVSTTGNYLEAIEIFSNFKGQGYGSDLIRDVTDWFSEVYDYYELSPIEEWLVGYYENHGFEITDRYKDNFSEYEVMKLIIY